LCPAGFVVFTMEQEQYIGEIFGRLKVVGVTRLKGKLAFDCVCECGNRHTANKHSITNGYTKSCGCLYRIDIVGQRFGKLTVLERVTVGTSSNYFRYVCDCGVERIKRASYIKAMKSCGCSQKPETTREYRDHPLYDVWKGMKQRCSNPKNISYKNYGAKGVTVCDLWKKDFVSFYTWCIENGWKEGMQIDKDLKGGNIYSPDNCTILSRTDNMRLSSIVKFTPSDIIDIRKSKDSTSVLAKRYGVNATTIASILKNHTWKL
jgi:hypothetical protein